mgnify:FL=1|jgi:hypothetical protein
MNWVQKKNSWGLRHIFIYLYTLSKNDLHTILKYKNNMDINSKETQTEFYLLEENDMTTIITDIKVLDETDDYLVCYCCMIWWWATIILSVILYFNLNQ